MTVFTFTHHPMLENEHHQSQDVITSWYQLCSYGLRGGGLLWNGTTLVLFCKSAIKMRKYIKKRSSNTWSSFWMKCFSRECAFHQDSAASHKATDTQTWLENNFPDFISMLEWMSDISDLNPLDYSLWDILEVDLCATRHLNLELLKKSIIEKADLMRLEVTCTTISQLPKSLAKCILAEGGHFE